MTNPNQPPVPQIQDPIELEVLAIHEVAVHPLIPQAELLLMGAILVGKSIESALEDVE